MGFEFTVGWRYLFSKKGNFLVSVLTIISVIGVALGVTAVLVVMGVVSGFENDFRKKILGNNAHIVVVEGGQRTMTKYEELSDEIRAVPGVRGASPFLYQEVLLRGKSERNTGSLLYGIDPQAIGQVTSLKTDMVEGSVEGLERQGSIPGIIVGAEMADHTLFLLLEDTVDVLSPSGEISPFGIGPKLRRFEVVGKFKSGLFEYDAHSAYVDLKEAQKFFGLPGQVSGIQVSLNDVNDAAIMALKLRAKLGDNYLVRTWMELNRDLFSAFRLEKTAFFIVMTMIILVAAFNIVGTLIIVVTEKQREVSILKAMGCTRRAIMRIFVATGLTIGAVGTAVGLVMAWILMILLRDYIRFPLNANVYQVDNLPVLIQGSDFWMVAIAALTISFLATLYPSLKASQLKPAEGLRYE